MVFKKAVKHEAKLRLALIGPAGSGKTYSALSIAQHLGERVAVVDTEHGSASKYADIFDFDTLAPDTFSPTVYIEAIEAAEEAGYDVLILDSLSHAWAGKGGLLEFVDNQAKKNRGNSFMAWREATPLHNRLIDTMLACNLHLIVTMRSKTEYVVEQDARGKTTIRKVGLQPVQRDGLEYEFDVTADLDLDNMLIVSKTRCPALKDKTFAPAGENIAVILNEWLSGEPAPEPKPKVEKQSGNGKRKRPLQPEEVRQAIAKKAQKYDGPDEISDEDARATVIGLSNLVLGNDEKRYALTKFLTSDGNGANGVTSTKDLTPAQAWAIRQWTDASKDNDWQPNEHSVVEASTILIYLETLGQQELPLGEEESGQ